MPINEISYEKPNVAFFSVDTQNSNNSGGSGETIVGNTYFEWERPDGLGAAGGFTGTNWWGTNIANGPTAIGGFVSDEAVTAHLMDPGKDLSAAFSAWQTYIDSEKETDPSAPYRIVLAFMDALTAKNGAGCMHSA